MRDITILLNLIRILSDGNIHSNKELGDLLGTTVTDINEYISTFYKWGIKVNSVADKGYQIFRKMDLLSYERIYSLVRCNNIIIKPIIDSTNQYLLERIGKLSSGCVCIAECQTAGRGRRGKYWVSPFGCNLYLSLYWCLHQKPIIVMVLSLLTGVVIAETLNKLSGSNIKVKWPNDIYLNEKKLAGILIETIGKTNDLIHIVIGIGINIARSYNHENRIHINQKWINLEQAGFQIERNIIASKIILALRNELVKFEKYDFISSIKSKKWLSLDTFLDKNVKLYINNQLITGVVKGINEYGEILLEKNGKIISYMGSEISLYLDN